MKERIIRLVITAAPTILSIPGTAENVEASFKNQLRPRLLTCRHLKPWIDYKDPFDFWLDSRAPRALSRGWWCSWCSFQSTKCWLSWRWLWWAWPVSLCCSSSPRFRKPFRSTSKKINNPDASEKYGGKRWADGGGERRLTW